MAIRGVHRTGQNALREGRALEARVDVTTRATPRAIYDTLADLQSHLEWAGRKQTAKTRLLTIDAPAGPATAGTEFTTTGADPMGTFSDRSVVTEASPGRVFEFVTEAALTPKRGGEPVEWTIVHRYEIAAVPEGSRISYAIRITRISRLPGMLRLLGTPLAGVVMKASASVARRGVNNLVALAEARQI